MTVEAVSELTWTSSSSTTGDSELAGVNGLEDVLD
jgi:hypothetical protein